MSERIDIPSVENSVVQKICSVEDFCRRYRLAGEDKTRLIHLFGQFAREQELLMNAMRAPVFR